MAKILQKKRPFDLALLHQWFMAHKRSFPWREEKTPYKVWISEVMLQQTRAEVVVPYFHRWMRLFPNISSIARAPLTKVLKAWEGLGYYQRARNIYRAAQIICEKFHGEFPESPEDMQSLPGIGPYILGAVTLFGWHKKEIAIDANVQRVLIRYLGINAPMHATRAYRQIAEYLSLLSYHPQPWVTNEALIELGAIVCQKNPQCFLCPIKNKCFAYTHDCVAQLPQKKDKKQYYKIIRAVAVIKCRKKLLVFKEKKGNIMADLYQFPYVPVNSENKEHSLHLLQKQFPFTYLYPLEEQKQSFTQYRTTLFPFFFHTDEEKKIQGYQWLSIDALQHKPFCSGHRKIFQQIKEGV